MNPNSDSGAQSGVLIIGAGFSIEGDIRGEGTLLIGGVVKGTVHANSVKLTESGVVNGHIQCKQLEVSGKLNGSFAATDVIVRQSGVVTAGVAVHSHGTCLIAGAMDVDLKANAVKVEKTGNLVGTVQAKQLDIFGRINGIIDATDIVVRSNAFIDGTVTYGSLAMERGANTNGQVQRKKNDTEPLKPSQVEDHVRVDLPLEVMKALRKKPTAESIAFTLLDGSELPSWILLNRESSCLMLEREKFDALVAEGGVLMLRLKVGEVDVRFRLPAAE